MTRNVAQLQRGHALAMSRCRGLRALPVILAFISGLAFFLLLSKVVPQVTFGYDEADYAYAASKGIAANYFDSPSISFADFLTRGLANVRARTHSEMRASPDQSLSEYIRKKDDVTFYRHFHGPLFFHGLTVAGHAFRYEERSLRFVSTLAVAITVGLSGYFLFRLAFAMFGQTTPAVFSGLVATSFAASSSILWGTGLTVTPHSLFAAVTALALGSSGMFLVASRDRWWNAAAVACGFGFLTIEYAPLLLISILLPVVGRATNRETRASERVRLILRVLLISSATIFVLWPGSVLKLTIVKNYLFFGFYSTAQAAEQYATLPLSTLWSARFAASPPLVVAAAVLLVLAVRAVAGRLVHPAAPPYVIYALLISLTSIRNRSLTPTYMASLIPALGGCLGLVACAITRPPRRIVRATVALFICALPISAWIVSWPAVRSGVAIRGAEDELIRTVRDRGAMFAVDGCLSVPWRLQPSLHFYAPSLTLRPYYGQEDPHSRDDLLEQFGRCRQALIVLPVSRGEVDLAVIEHKTIAVTSECRYMIIKR